jgi:hypothetical protein
MASALADGGAGDFTATTVDAQSTGSFEHADIENITFTDLSSMDVTAGSPFTVTVTIADDGTASTEVTQ